MPPGLAEPTACLRPSCAEQARSVARTRSISLHLDVAASRSARQIPARATGSDEQDCPSTSNKPPKGSGRWPRCAEEGKLERHVLVACCGRPRIEATGRHQVRAARPGRGFEHECPGAVPAVRPPTGGRPCGCGRGAARPPLPRRSPARSADRRARLAQRRGRPPPRLGRGVLAPGRRPRGWRPSNALRPRGLTCSARLANPPSRPPACS
jgi:hypothetical protein